MSTELNAALPDRQAYPFAVGVRQPGEEQVTYLHFNSKPAADLTAHLLDTEANEVTRWVALIEDEWSANAPVPGWRQVSYFVQADS